MSINEQEILQEFIAEATEHLADVESQLLAIEAGGADVDGELVNQVFRAVHSVKGAAGFLQLDEINRLAHSLENVLNRIRNRELIPESRHTDVMLRGADLLRIMIGCLPHPSGADATELRAELDRIADGAEVPEERSELEALEELPAPEAELEPPGVPVGVRPAAKHAADGAAAAPATVTHDANIRVSVAVLDRLMNLAGELVLSRNQLLQAIGTPDQSGLETAAAELDHVTSELQEAIMQTRMQPIGNTLGRFPRVVRDLSAKLGKQVDLQMEGKEVEVDKSIVEAIADPLTHLVRNAVDHGIEPPAARQAAGKRPQGAIRLRAFHQAGKVLVEITDDGGGIDPDKLKRKAVEKGVITAEHAQRLTDREALRLIFHPGFSTAEKVSDVSGRGVGMDVVRSNIERLGGTVDVESQVGAGTTIRVSLPLTLAIIPSMIVRCGQQRFAIPQSNIAELVRLRPDEARRRLGVVKSGEVLRLRGSLLPLVRLARVLQFDEPATTHDESPVHVIVVESGSVRYGLLVDGISDSEEIVVKPLGRHFKGCGYLAGATILGDGRVALILDVGGVAARADFQGASGDEEATDESTRSEQGVTERQTLLVFRSDPAEQFAVPMEVVSRIERVRADALERVGGRELLMYHGEPLPLIAVEDGLAVRPRPQTDHVHVIVFATSCREIGLVAPELADICEVEAAIDAETFRAPGVAGALAIDDRLTRLLDVFALAEAIHPQWFEQLPATPPSETPRRILLAEDSHFFRTQVAGFLTSAGFEVDEAGDGQEAWDALLEDATPYCLVVSDIEMPRMNGYELCERIKRHAGTASLPVIALTSLSSDEHMRRGREAGFDDYQIKMHRDNLLEAVRRLSAGKAAGGRRGGQAARRQEACV